MFLECSGPAKSASPPFVEHHGVYGPDIIVVKAKKLQQRDNEAGFDLCFIRKRGFANGVQKTHG